jgi:hypothetical protein
MLAKVSIPVISIKKIHMASRSYFGYVLLTVHLAKFILLIRLIIVGFVGEYIASAKINLTEES